MTATTSAPSVTHTLTQNELRALSIMAMAEAGVHASSEHHTYLVASIMNRVAHPAWPDDKRLPNTVDGVLKDPGQFEPMRRYGRDANTGLYSVEAIAKNKGFSEAQIEAAMQKTVASLDMMRSPERERLFPGIGQVTSFQNVRITQERGTTFCQGKPVLAATEGHSFYGPDCFSEQPPVPEYKTAYASDETTQTAVRDARQGTLYAGIVRSNLDPAQVAALLRQGNPLAPQVIGMAQEMSNPGQYSTSPIAVMARGFPVHGTPEGKSVVSQQQFDVADHDVAQPPASTPPSFSGGSKLDRMVASL